MLVLKYLKFLTLLSRLWQLNDSTNAINITLTGPIAVSLSVHNPLAMIVESNSTSASHVRATLFAASPSERDLIALCLKALVKVAGSR